MEDVAAMLNAVAGGLQQSFGTVFERVGQSLEQSAQMMQMMNAMMEAAMLQNLVVGSDMRAAPPHENGGSAPFMLHVTVENRSQININEATIGFRIDTAVESPDLEVHALEQGLVAKSSAEMNFPVDQTMLGQEATIVLRVRSPGTSEWLQKNVPFRIPVLKMARVEAVASVLLSSEVASAQEYSDDVELQFLRKALGVSAFDALLTADTGYYRLCVPAGIFASSETEIALQIQQTTESPSGVRVMATTRVVDDVHASQRWCRLVLEELDSR